MVMSMETISTRPPIFGSRVSGPDSVSDRLATAVTTSLATSLALRLVMRMVPGKPASGAMRTWPCAEMVPESQVWAVSRSMRMVSPRALSRPVMLLRRTPRLASR